MFQKSLWEFAGCQQPDCGSCTECLDMKFFGGPGMKKKACPSRKCSTFSTAHAEIDTGTLTVAATISKASSLVHDSDKIVFIFITKKSCANLYEYDVAEKDCVTTAIIVFRIPKIFQ